MPLFSAEHLEAACKVLADKDRGLTASEIKNLFKDCALKDVSPEKINWKRLFNALANAQNTHHVGNHLIMFITRALNPAKYAQNKKKFAWRRSELNVVLSFSGLNIRDDGKVIRISVKPSSKEAHASSEALLTSLKNRNAHPEILTHCRTKLLEKNYFHAVHEAIRGVAKRIRNLSGLTTDGAELVYTAFSVKKPILALNSLKTETEVSEQMGFGNVLMGLFGAVRNPTDRNPDTTWPMTEQDVLEILSLVSFVHRKLDGTVKI